MQYVYCMEHKWTVHMHTSAIAQQKNAGQLLEEHSCNQNKLRYKLCSAIHMYSDYNCDY